MSFLNCGCKASCTPFGIVVSLVAGIVALVLTLTGTITISTVFAWVAFGIAVGFVLVSFLAAAFTRGCDTVVRRCVCKSLAALQTGALGTTLTALLLLAVGFVATSTLGAVIYGLFVFFFVLLLFSAVCLTRCFASCND